MSEDENKRQYQFGEKLRAVRERKHLTFKNCGGARKS